MSKSRLEKFLYALYSLDSSDLPTPLSRIEELYKCWVTGEETPTFKPISRVEKYLMAILGCYDVDSLPNPLSRVEVLLYKLVTGDDSLEGFDTFLSEHEELLAEIIRNGGVGGNIDIEYVLYTLSTEHNTLYNTAAKPIKSAILTGQTLVNIFQDMDYVWNNLTKQDSFNYNGDLIILNNGYSDGRIWNSLPKIPNIKSNTEYTMIFTKGSSPSVEFGTVDESGNSSALKKYINAQKVKITSPNNGDLRVKFCVKNPTSDKSVINLGKVMFIEGDYTNVDIPYFEGIQSVKMPVLTTTGKNLFDINHFSKLENWDGKTSSERPYYAYEMKLKPNTSYIFSRKENSTANNVYFCISKNQGVYDWTGGIIHPTDTSAIYQQRTITTDSTGILYFNLYQAHNELANLIPLLEDTQLEESSAVTTYEPFKSNILTVNEEVELRGIGEVQDELNLLTGELIQRVEEFIIDKNTNIAKYQDVEGFNTTGYHVNFPSNFVQNATGFICNSLPKSTAIKIQPNMTPVDEEGIDINYGNIKFRVSNEKGTNVEDFKKYLEVNPIKLIIPLVEKSVKTVDLSVVDQDGDNTNLSTFDDITHVTLSSEGLIPEVELEVATKNEEVLNTMSLEMDDISTAQTTLEETSNTQSENVDATMIATTEIYEEIL